MRAIISFTSVLSLLNLVCAGKPRLVTSQVLQTASSESNAASNAPVLANSNITAFDPAAVAPIIKFTPVLAVAAQLANTPSETKSIDLSYKTTPTPQAASLNPVDSTAYTPAIESTSTSTSNRTKALVAVGCGGVVAGFLGLALFMQRRRKHKRDNERRTAFSWAQLENMKLCIGALCFDNTVHMDSDVLSTSEIATHVQSYCNAVETSGVFIDHSNNDSFSRKSLPAVPLSHSCSLSRYDLSTLPAPLEQLPELPSSDHYGV